MEVLSLVKLPSSIEVENGFIPKGCFTLWQKVERLLISTNHVARHQEFGLSALHTKAKVQRPTQFKIQLFDEGDELSKEVWVGQEWKLKLWSRCRRFFPIKNPIISKILPLDCRGCFGQRIKVGCSFGFGLWARPLEASYYSWPTAPILIYCIGYVFQAHLFGLSRKFDHSISWPLDIV
jgi:hypothetical protein